MFDHQERETELTPGMSVSELLEDDDALHALTRAETADWVEPERLTLPKDIESMHPDLFLAAIVSSVDRSRLNGYDLVRLLEAEARLESAATASKLSTVAEVVHCPPGDEDSPVERQTTVVEYASAEIAAALRVTRRSADALLDRSLWLATSGHRVGAALASGQLSLAKATAFHRTLAHLDAETVETVLDQVLEAADELTSGQLSYRLAKLVMAFDPDGAKSSLEAGITERRVVAQPNPDFTGCFHICSCDPDAVAGAMSHVDSVARRLKTEGETRSLDQLRSDVALSLLQGIDPEAPKTARADQCTSRSRWRPSPT